jgi:hypothetical protein
MEDDAGLHALYAALDTHLAALLAPLARALRVALGRAADSRSGQVPTRRLGTLREVLDREVGRIFGDSPRDQFDQAGVPQTPIATLVGGGIRAATHLAIAPLYDQQQAPRPTATVTLTGNPPPTSIRPRHRLDTARTWVDPSGHRLSDRLWQNGQEVRSAIDALLEQGINAGTDAVTLGRQLGPHTELLIPGAGGCR